jgi:hypothetical protein
LNTYFDIESEGINPREHKIITIQYQPIDSRGFPKGDLVILKSWESSEEDIVRKFHKVFITNSIWDFIPVGFNLIFDFSFILMKFEQYGLSVGDKMDFMFQRPYIDLRHTLVIANQMSFKGSSLSNLTTKKDDGMVIPNYFKEKKYDLIDAYIRQETEAFLKAFQTTIEHNKILKEKLKQ